MPCIPDVLLLWYHDILLASEWWPVWKELFSFLRTCSLSFSLSLTLAHSLPLSASPHVESAGLFLCDGGAECKYCDGWLSGCRAGLLARRGVNYVGKSQVCDGGQADNGGLHSNHLSSILLNESSVNTLSAQGLNGAREREATWMVCLMSCL